MKALICIFCLLVSSDLIAQNCNNIWCFGDSAGIDFSNLNNPAPIHSAVKSRGSCVSICDTNSNILFYAYTRATIAGNTTFVKNRMDSLMLNGNNIVGEGWYMELVIIPFPDDSNKFYLFSIGVAGTAPFGLYYSVIDMTLDSSFGEVTQKNIQLLPYPASDGLTCVKHGNGRDWWVIFRKNGGWAGWYDNRLYKYLVTPTGVNFVDSQAIGSQDLTNLFRYVFNKTGDKLAVVMYDGIIETFDFDRCTGLLSNHILIRPKNTSSPYPGLFSCAFSPNDRFLYVSTNGNPTSHLIQIDLQNSMPWLNADTLWSDSIYPFLAGALRLAPDDKIYLTCAWNSYVVPNYPYPDTTYDLVNTHLSVINYPDSLDSACNFTPYSFYLGGGRTYWGLPNNPDYDMPRIVGSPCDTVWSGIPPNLEGEVKGVLYTSYISEWQKLFVNAQNIQGKNARLRIYDLNGRVVFSSQHKIKPPYFTEDVDVSMLSYGMYVVSFATESEVLNKKFVKN